MKILFFLFFTSIAFSQKPISVKILSIKTENVDAKNASYIINYEIKNNTNNAVSFFLNPNTLIANAASSMTLFAVYKLYINNEATKLDGPFFEKDGIDWREKLKSFKNYNSEEAKAFIKKTFEEFEKEQNKIVENYTKNGGKNTDKAWILKNQKLLESKITIEPNETKLFTIVTHWNRERYFKQDDLEYYLTENDKYEFELTLSLQKDNLKSQLSNEEYQKIEKDPNFLQGDFTSNKAAIYFN